MNGQEWPHKNEMSYTRLLIWFSECCYCERLWNSLVFILFTMNIIVLWSEDIILNNILKDLTKKSEGQTNYFEKSLLLFIEQWKNYLKVILYNIPQSSLSICMNFHKKWMTHKINTDFFPELWNINILYCIKAWIVFRQIFNFILWLVKFLIHHHILYGLCPIILMTHIHCKLCIKCKYQDGFKA